MPADSSPRFTWRRQPRHLLRPQEPLPPIMGPFTYNAYGQDTDPLPEAAVGDAHARGPLFQGIRYDPKDAALFQQPRAFSPELAKWVQADLTHFEDGLNYYTFDGENPINQVSPLGT